MSLLIIVWDNSAIEIEREELADLLANAIQFVLMLAKPSLANDLHQNQSPHGWMLLWLCPSLLSICVPIALTCS